MTFGLIGHPIAHSLSPALFKAGYDGRYPYELIETEDFEEAYNRFVEGYDGINVTAPFKELAFAKAEILSEECKAVRATNLLVKTPEGIKAYNSDFRGVRMWLEERFLDFTRNDVNGTRNDVSGTRNVNGGQADVPTVLTVGLGGAGKAAAAAAGSLGMNVLLMNRTQFDSGILPLTDFCRYFRQADIIIYNIPAAIPQLEELTEDDFRGGKECRAKHILEANYRNPSFDANLLQKMSKANPLAEYTSGRTWLLYQAVTGYEIFTGETPDLAKMSDVL